MFSCLLQKKYVLKTICLIYCIKNYDIIYDCKVFFPKNLSEWNRNNFAPSIAAMKLGDLSLWQGPATHNQGWTTGFNRKRLFEAVTFNAKGWLIFFSKLDGWWATTSNLKRGQWSTGVFHITLLVSRSEYPRDKPFLLTMVSYLKKINEN